MVIKLPISVRDRHLLLARFSKNQVYFCTGKKVLFWHIYIFVVGEISLFCKKYFCTAPMGHCTFQCDVNEVMVWKGGKICDAVKTRCSWSWMKCVGSEYVQSSFWNISRTFSLKSAILWNDCGREKRFAGLKIPVGKAAENFFCPWAIQARKSWLTHVSVLQEEKTPNI